MKFNTAVLSMHLSKGSSAQSLLYFTSLSLYRLSYCHPLCYDGYREGNL